MAFLLDASGSVEENFELAQNLAKHIVSGLNFQASGTRVSVVIFSDEARIQFTLDQYTRQDEVLNAIAFKNDMERTGTASGLAALHSQVFTPANGDRNGVANYAIVVTDGRSNINQQMTSSEAATLRGVADVFAVGVGHNGQVDRMEIFDIATNPDSDYAHFMESVQDLDTIADSILDVICR